MNTVTDDPERAQAILSSPDGVLMPSAAKFLVSQTFYPAAKCLEVLSVARGFAESEAASEMAEVIRLAIGDLGKKLQ